MSDNLELHALADGELSSEEAARVESRIANCAASMAEYKAILAMRDASAKLKETVSCDTTWSACRSRLDEIDKSRKVEGFIGRYAWGLAAMFLFLIFGAGQLNRDGGNPLSTSDVARVLSGMGPTLDSPRAAPPEQMGKWLRDVVGDRPSTIQFERLQISAAIECSINGRRGALMRLHDGEGVLELLVIPDADRIADAPDSASSGDVSPGYMGRVPCVSWCDQGFAFFLVAPRSHDALLATVENIRVR